MRRTLCCVCALMVAAGARAQHTPAGPSAEARLARVTARVEEFYARARTVMSKETVRIQPLAADFAQAPPARQLVYDRRVSWEPASSGGPPPEASVLRQLLTVNGRPPRPRDEPQCLDPKDVTSDALAMLLPQNIGEYEFKPAGDARVDGRVAVTLDYRSRSKEPPSAEWTKNGECVQVSVPDRTRGRLWIDAATDDVLRLDEYLTGMVDFPVPRQYARIGMPVSIVIERADTSIRYRAVSFTDPDETLMLPRLIETTTVWRNTAVNRVRMTQTFSEYRRFVTDGRIVADDDPR